VSLNRKQSRWNGSSAPVSTREGRPRPGILARHAPTACGSARVLALASVLLFDEPFTSLDDKAIAILQTLLKDASAAGRTIIMSTHQIREAMELATHVALIGRGQLIYSGGRTQQMLEDPGWLYRTYGESS